MEYSCQEPPNGTFLSRTTKLNIPVKFCFVDFRKQVEISKIIEDVKMLTYQLWLGMWKNSQLYTNKVLLLEITVV